ncbi:unnamed protein product [Oppiella nova]|uniref:Uncharacterized protein n=1 Tax=Oppiella nova TaxID=334625 RepID=A0A7R9LLE1_9ACAR|nr:unnamed protein product [Oppiella nova]CAG2164805.1 unnamed protein product [Oppiella nova]
MYETMQRPQTLNYVYFETSSTSPFLIRRIEELIKTPNGNVEAKVMCFFRRRDISGSLIVLADKHQIRTGSIDCIDVVVVLVP